jgi:hypothetical protein
VSLFFQFRLSPTLDQLTAILSSPDLPLFDACDRYARTVLRTLYRDAGVVVDIGKLAVGYLDLFNKQNVMLRMMAVRIPRGLFRYDGFDLRLREVASRVARVALLSLRFIWYLNHSLIL